MRRRGSVGVYCSRCHIDEASSPDTRFINYQTQGDRRYYFCTACNTKRAAKYRSTENGRLRINQAVARSLASNRAKQNARARLGYHLKKGTLVAPSVCKDCGMTAKVQGHHPDYNKPLEVIWLCVNCHAKLHRELGTGYGRQS